MKKLTSLLSIIGLVMFGWIAGIQNKLPTLPTQTVQAAQIPLDLRLGRVETVRDTVYMPSDTVYLPGKNIVVTKTKEVPVPYIVNEPTCFVIPGSLFETQADRIPTVAKQSESPIDSVPARNDNRYLE